MIQHKARNITFSVITLGVICAVVWWMSAHVVWLGDDLDYKYMMKGAIWQSWGRIHTWHDFWHSQWIHYQNVNGRFVAHALVQLFNGLLGQQTFAICNALVYPVFIIMLARIGKVRIAANYGGLFTAAAICMVCFITKMMPTCQIGYIWAMTANMIWLDCFFTSRSPSWAKVAVMFLLGAIAGNWQESVSLGVCAEPDAGGSASLATAAAADERDGLTGAAAGYFSDMCLARHRYASPLPPCRVSLLWRHHFPTRCLWPPIP